MKHAAYDANTGRVTHWWPDDHPRELLPEPNVIVSEQQWKDHFIDPNNWFVEDGQLEYRPFQAPAEAPISSRAVEMLTKGVEVVFQEHPDLSGTYPCSIQSLAIDAGLLAAVEPDRGVTVYDVAGKARIMPPEQFKAYARAKLDFVQALHAILGSNTGTLPDHPVVIP